MEFHHQPNPKEAKWPRNRTQCVHGAPDGHTFGDLHGCKIVSAPNEWDNEDMEDALRGRHADSDQLWLITEFRTGGDDE